MDRRELLKTSAILAVSTTLVGCNKNNRQAIDYSKHPSGQEGEQKQVHINRNRKTILKLATSWPAHFPIMGRGVERFVERIATISGGSLEFKLYPKNTLIPALAVFDAASSGQIDAFHSGPYYWKGKNSAFSLFSGYPFGFTAEEINSWLFFGGGLELWRKLYSQYNLYPFSGGNTNIQMGGWFRRPIQSLEDMQGLKMRIPGLGGELFAKLGVNPILLPAGEIYTSLERGVIDATEWVGPALDYKMGFYKVAPFYYSGWHEPGSVLELTFNKKRFDSLSNEHKAMIEVASNEMNAMMATEFHAENIKALKVLKEKGITISPYPEDVVLAAKKALLEVMEEFSAKSEDFKEVYKSASAYLGDSIAYSDISLKAFLQTR